MTGALAATAAPRAATEAVPRAVVLGASNLAKGLGTVVDTAQRAHGRPLEMLVALGHGRSYGRTTRVLGRQLPGILECALWRDLAARPAASTSALVTDIGNDLLYEEPVERITAWIEQCLDRLAAVRAHTVVTLLPLESLALLSPVRFRLLRSLFFPHSRISLGETAERAGLLDEHIRRLAAERDFRTVAHSAAWYGFDPIHIRFSRRRHAWREILAPWSTTPESLEPAGNCLVRTLALRLRAPAERRLFGIRQRGRQPAARLSNGTTVALY